MLVKLGSQRSARSTVRANHLTGRAIDGVSGGPNASGNVVHRQEQNHGRTLRALARALEGLADPDVVAQELGLPTPLAEVPDELWEVGHFTAFWRALMRRVPDPTLPLAVGDAVAFGTFDVVDYLASSCATLGEGLERLARYFALVTPNLVWNTRPSERAIELICKQDAPEERLVNVQFTLGVTFGRFRRMTSPFSLRRVALAIPEPPNRGRHDAYFCCPIEYGASPTKVWFPDETWTGTMQRHEPGLMMVLERHAQDRLAELVASEDPLAPVRRSVRERLPDGPPKVGSVAKGVAMSTRTLQRRLRDAGTTFQELVDQEREAAARAYLGDRSLGVTDISFMLGYSDASAFVRAFKRWTGMTPTQYRAA